MSDRSLGEQFSKMLRPLNAGAEDYVPQLVDLIIQQASNHRASDVHLVPTEDQLQMRWRVDGVLHSVAGFGAELIPRVVARLKVVSGLLTYRTDLPQEGRISNFADATANREVRVTTFPSLYGEKVAIRLFASEERFRKLSDLGLPEDVESEMRRHLQATSGVILLTGPSGSGKTTTGYACLREIVEASAHGKSIMTLEDPIEVAVAGTTQSQVNPGVGFDLSAGLKSMLRQDPDVILVGEIRDPETAEGAFQAALTGHLVLTTFHAGSSVEGLTRLLDLGIEPYLIRSSLRASVCQRLLRRRCDCEKHISESRLIREIPDSADKVASGWGQAGRCRVCDGLGYHGRFVTAEILDLDDPELAAAILDRADSRRLTDVAESGGFVSIRDRSQELVARGSTTEEEVFRVLGCRTSP